MCQLPKVIWAPVVEVAGESDAQVGVPEERYRLAVVLDILPQQCLSDLLVMPPANLLVNLPFDS